MRRVRGAEDEQGTPGDMGDMADVADSPKLKIQCPKCGTKQAVRVPPNFSLAEAEAGEDEDEADVVTVPAKCKTCRTSMSVNAPAGSKFSYVPNKFTRGDEDEDDADDSRRGSNAGYGMGKKRKTEATCGGAAATRRFNEVYYGQDYRAVADAADDANAAFWAVLREARRAARGASLSPP